MDEPLVPERALRKLAEDVGMNFGPWIYGLKYHARPPQRIPQLLKLHGSVNWEFSGEKNLKVRTQNWSDFDDAPGYQAKGAGSHFPIYLPFWDKRIEEEPWLRLWKKAYNALNDAETILVWGYSLPHTDVKARQLFTLASTPATATRLCVVDPSASSRDKWRELYQHASYWEYSSIEEFFEHPPDWWDKPAKPLS